MKLKDLQSTMSSFMDTVHLLRPIYEMKHAFYTTTWWHS